MESMRELEREGEANDSPLNNEERERKRDHSWL